METEKCKAYFHYVCENIEWPVRLSGSTVELGTVHISFLIGCWDPSKSLPLVKNPSNQKEFISPEVALPKRKIDFKFLKYVGDKIVWEPSSFGDNYSAYLSNHKLVHITVNEGKSMAILRADTKFNKRPEIPAQRWKCTTDLSELRKFTEKIVSTGEEELIVASFELPLIVEKKNEHWITELSDKPFYPSLYKFIAEKYKNVKWVGYINIPDTATEKDKEEIEKLLNQHKCVPVYLEKKLSAEFRNYCEEVLYPFIYNFLSPSDNLEQIASGYWKIYKIVNCAFASTIIKLCNSNPIIWLNDIHLLMCPFMIVRKNVNANIGLFLHSAFPSREIYKVFPYREEILRSMLCCNIIGFHVYHYAHNFLLSCQCIAGSNYQIQ